MTTKIPRTRHFAQVDVFTDTPYQGNPLAVVLDGTGLTDAEMQRFARWTNLSETTFVLPPSPEGAAAGADYRVRIFTPAAELPFAGHPTLGTCHAWLHAGGQARQADLVVQECQAGLVRIRRQGHRLAFAAPPVQRLAVSDATLAPLLEALGVQRRQVLAAQHLDNGPHWLGLLLDSADTVLELEPDHLHIKALGHKVGVAGIYAASSASGLIARSNREARAFASAALAEDTQLEVRAFAAPVGVHEDPVTGSLNASLAQWLIAEGHMPARYVAGQGCRLGRDGRVSIEQDAQGQVWVGGNTVHCISGSVAL